MRCDICDKALTDKEINWNDDLKSYEPCTVCLDAAMDAAYSSSFMSDDEFVLLEDFDNGDKEFYDFNKDIGDSDYDR
jgi:hypothetical protein